jgi:hypothetical protein
MKHTLWFWFFLLVIPQPARIPGGTSFSVTIPSKRYGGLNSCQNNATLWNGVVVPAGVITTLPCTEATIAAPPAPTADDVAP